MKRILFLAIFLIFTACPSAFSQNEDYYSEKISEYVAILESSADATTNNELIYNLKRLTVTFHDKWEARYYLAYCLFRNALLDQNNAKYHFKQTLDYIDSLDKGIVNSHADMLILKARVLLMILSQDQSRGPELAPLIISLIETAKAMEPNNSRAFYMEGLYYYTMPKFAGGNKGKAKTSFRIAHEKFKQESKTAIPRWIETLYTNALSFK